MTAIDNFFGTVILPEDDEFELFLAAYPAGAPSIVLRPQTVEDVATAVRYATDNGLVISVRSGGHSGGAYSTVAGGLVLDLSALDSIECSGTTVRIGAGGTWGSVAEALGAYGLAISSGDTRSVGVGGLTLGGGIGWMVRKYGLALDSLVAVELVTASGELLVASESVNPDLFWALRGGGGNFGVVTSFTFEAFPLESVWAGPIVFADDVDLAALLTGWRDVMRSAPEELNVTFLTMPAMGPELPAATQLLVCYAGSDEAEASEAFRPLLALPGIVSHDIVPKRYAEVLDEPVHQEGPPLRLVGSNGFAVDFSDEAAVRLEEMYRNLGESVLMIRYLRGAFNRVDAAATAFAWRQSEVLVISVAFLPLDIPESEVSRMAGHWELFKPHTLGSYGNFIPFGGEKAVSAMFPSDTRDRLAEIKRRHDPGNVFSQTQNILPAATKVLD